MRFRVWTLSLQTQNQVADRYTSIFACATGSAPHSAPFTSAALHRPCVGGDVGYVPAGKHWGRLVTPPPPQSLNLRWSSTSLCQHWHRLTRRQARQRHTTLCAGMRAINAATPPHTPRILSSSLAPKPLLLQHADTKCARAVNRLSPSPPHSLCTLCITRLPSSCSRPCISAQPPKLHQRRRWSPRNTHRH